MNRIKRLENILKKIQKNSTGVIVIDKNKLHTIDVNDYDVVIIDDITGEEE